MIEQAMAYPAFVWLALMGIFLVVEIITVGLTSVWFAGGAFAALLFSLLHVSLLVQIAVFFVVTIVLLFFTRPFVLKYVKPHNVRTNYEELIGKEVQILERVDNRADTGKANFNGMEWTARSTKEDVTIEAGESAYVSEIRGVKLYVHK